MQSFRIDRELGDVPFLSLDLGRFAVTHTREGNLRLAARLLACSVAMFDRIGFTPESWMTRELDEATDAVRARLDPDDFAAAWAEGAALTLDEAIALALDESTTGEQ